MTQEKMRKLISAIVAAATVLLVILLSVLIYQWIKLAVLNNRIEKVKAENVEYKQEIEEGENDLSYYQSDFYKQLEAFKLGLIKGQK
jgi:cell division protein FtsB